MSKISIMLRSRTVWTIVALVIINGVGSVRELLPAGSLTYVDIILGLLATYFRVNPQAEKTGEHR